MNLTETQKCVLLWLVKEERAGSLDKEEIWFTPIFPNGMSLISYKGTIRNIPQIKKTTLDALKSSGCLICNGMGKYALTDKAYEAVDSNFVGNGDTQNNSFNHDQIEEEAKQEGDLESKQTGLENVTVVGDAQIHTSLKINNEPHKIINRIGMVVNRTIIQNLHLDPRSIFVILISFGFVITVLLLVFEYIRNKNLYQPTVVDNSEIKNTQQSLQDDVQRTYSRAKERISKNFFEGGIQELTTVIQSDPKYIPAYIDRGLANRQIGNHKLAIQDFEKAISLSLNKKNLKDTTIKLHNNICGEYRLLAQQTKQDSVNTLNKAKYHCNEAISLANSQDANPFFNRGVIFAMLGNKESSINDFEEAKRIALVIQNDSYLFSLAEKEIRKIKSIEEMEEKKCFEDLSDPSCYAPTPESPIIIYEEEKKCIEDLSSPTNCPYLPPVNNRFYDF